MATRPAPSTTSSTVRATPRTRAAAKRSRQTDRSVIGSGMDHAAPRSGTLTYDELQQLVASGAIQAPALSAAQIQPASIDLTLSEEAYRLPGSVLPLVGERVRELIQ